MKIKYEFDTDSENFDKRELEIFQNADKYAAAISDLSDIIKDLNHHQYKWNEYRKEHTGNDFTDFITSEFNEILEKYKIDVE
jgi:hypothetical protein